MKVKITITKYKCERCGHIWSPRKNDVRICPKCKSPYFDKPKKKKHENI